MVLFSLVLEVLDVLSKSVPLEKTGQKLFCVATVCLTYMPCFVCVLLAV